MRCSARHLSLTGLAVAALVTGLVLWVRLVREPRPPPGPLAAVTVGDLEQTVLATGKLRPKEVVSVGSQVSGQVKRLYVSLGDSVRAGDPIAEIDAQPQRLALKAALAAVDALRAQRAAREAALAQAEAAFRRQQMLISADATARADFEAARATLDSTRAEVAALAAQIVQAQTQADTSRTSLGYTRILAPMDGVVIAIVTKQGQTVNAIQSVPTLVMLAKLDVMTVRAEISEADVEKVQPGQTVWFTTLGAPGRRHYSRIQRVDPAPESVANDGAGAAAAAGSQGDRTTAIYYVAQFDVPNPGGRLRPSMTVQVSVLLARAHEAILVPAAAVGPQDPEGRASVRVVDARGRSEVRTVEVGIGDENSFVVLSGLNPGEQVALTKISSPPPPIEADALLPF